MGASDHHDEEHETAIVRCGTTKGDITLQLIREWSPIRYDRAVELFERNFYDGCHFFRVLPKFLVQFGISYSKNNELQSFAKSTIQDDPRQLATSNKIINFESRIISYAGNGPNSRTSHLFISYGSAQSLGTELWETPIGKVIGSSMKDVAENFYGGYGDEPPGGNGPKQGKIYSGPEYIKDNFPLLDRILECTVERTKSSGTGRDSDGGDYVNSNKVRRTEAESDAVASNDDDDNDSENNNKGDDDDAENRNYQLDKYNSNSNDSDDEENENEEEDKAVTHDDDVDDDDGDGNNEFQKGVDHNDDDDGDDDGDSNISIIQQQQRNIRSVGRDKMYLHYNEDNRMHNGESNNTTTIFTGIFSVALIGF